MAEAEAKRAEAAAALADIERTRSGFARERDAILAAAQKTAEQAHAALVLRAAKEAASLEAAAKAAVAKEKEAAEKAWADRASHLAIDIARRLAARLDGPAVQEVFLDWLMKEIRNLPDAARQAVTASGATLEAISATLLDHGISNVTARSLATPSEPASRSRSRSTLNSSPAWNCMDRI